MSGRGAERILSLIEWMAEQPSSVAFMDAVRQLDLPKSSALSLFRLLTEQGYARRGTDGRYVLLRLPGEASAERRRWGVLKRQAQAPLQAAVDTLGESGFIAVLEDDLNVRYLLKLLPAREIRYDRDITIERRPHRVSSGLILLGGLSDDDIAAYAAQEAQAGRLDEPTKALIKRIHTAREAGIQSNPRGVVEGAAGVAAPITDGQGRIVAALNVAGPADRLAEDIGRVERVVREAASAVSQAMAAASASPSIASKEPRS
ncbi:IclR family transcriptional regulator C-terminal domain-containing protein [Salinisphaera sp. T31B1]|uniref:IclR family transcriptional regulator n=1 Tax=Salinisphaera sp. T31B1 TaxID=727963 RepID=UPI0033411D54